MLFESVASCPIFNDSMRALGAISALAKARAAFSLERKPPDVRELAIVFRRCENPALTMAKKSFSSPTSYFGSGRISIRMTAEVTFGGGIKLPGLTRKSICGWA